MKTYNKTFLPDSINYLGIELKMNSFISSAMMLNNTNPKTIIETLKKENRKAVLVNVLSKNLKGRADLYGKQYQPTKWIYSN
jgi:hypothetical protein